ncbi:MAG: DNA-directed RNA polymerase subunit alpha [Patescibacteria group bacterium]|jgi:DNA-directed RNA polymerase subunit alpha
MDSFPLPQNFIEEKSTKSEGTFVLEPCYPGYGVTIGNALRRVLLSSLPGAAITSVKIEGVDHEFTAIEGVKEDAVNILLNLKSVRLKLNDTDSATLTLKAKGKKIVTAKDFEKNSQVEVMNADQPIATLTSDAKEFIMEVTVGMGRGYVPVEAREEDDEESNEIGRIAIDSIFTPIRTVNYDVEHVRVGKITNFDRLTISVTTDGSLSPKEAMEEASSMLVDHFMIVKKGPKKQSTQKKSASSDVSADIAADEAPEVKKA